MLKNKVYILGKIPKYIDKKTRNQFTLAKEHLIKIGFKDVINPMDNFKKNDGFSKESIKANLKLLFECDSVYVLPSVNIKSNKIELLIVIQLNLLIIHGTIIINNKMIKKNDKKK
ncbi:DUF4406 domain-containing protein [Flavobacterium sp.]|uniref:DUF4406 domain-containing protein n=1 Tax=Flavobacterium sp. TaxID=239 RepID=UPI00261FAA5F|nr:DUF4406 domain-containing protein [Flavobacterium sp.]